MRAKTAHFASWAAFGLLLTQDFLHLAADFKAPGRRSWLVSKRLLQRRLLEPLAVLALVAFESCHQRSYGKRLKHNACACSAHARALRSRRRR